MAGPKAGWHPDGTNSRWVRWWDGKAWADAYWPTSLAPRDYMPGAPRVDISSPGEPRFDIVGEAYREAEILAAIHKTRTPRDVEFETFGVAELVPEPDNPHDSGAISVRLDGHCVGYLPAESSADFYPVLSRFISSGVVPTVRTRIWGVTRFVRSRNQDELKSAIRVALRSPEDILPSNSIPVEPHFLIPQGRSIQVTGEQEHLDVLAKYVQPAGSSRIVVTLHPIAGKSKTPSTVLEVQLDGQRVGQLTSAMSAVLMPMVQEAQSHNRAAAAWATLSGSRLAAEVALKVMRAEEVPNTWPSNSDVLPQLGGAANGIPPAYKEQVQLTPPPSPSGVGVGIWIAAAIVAVLLLAIPYVGWLLAVALVAGTAWWSMAKRRVAPKGSVRSLA
jgi:hypothetical protein